MRNLLIKGGQIYQEGAFVKADILCENGRITEIGDLHARPCPNVIDASGKKVVPGFIDIHTHGGCGVDVNQAGQEGLRKLSAFFASQGTTAFQASVLTDTPETTASCLSDARAVMTDGAPGAQLLGVHLEGPFLAPAYKGAMPEHLLRKGDPALLRGWLDQFPGVIRYMTVSPEVEGVIPLIRAFKDEIVIAIGHSGATCAQAAEAIEAGARGATHLFNAMRPIHHHEPGIVGAALNSDCRCEMICDGRHLHPETIRLILRCIGYDRAVAITDSIMAAGLPDGQYKLGVNDVIVRDGDATLPETGVRAGSTLTAINALRNLIAFTKEPLERILPLLTANPASLLRIADHKGFLRAGYDADLVLLDDTLHVCSTIVGGRVVYQS